MLLLIMKIIIFLISYFFCTYCFTSEYNLKILGENSIKEIAVNNEKLQIAETNFKWTDSDANFGKGYCLGSINSIDSEVKLNFLCEFLDYEGESFWTKINRNSSDISSGIGTQKYIKVTKKYKKLLNKECKYAVSWFDKTSFLIEQRCNM